MEMVFCTVIETKSYYLAASRLLDNDQMSEISEILAVLPEIGDIISGTGGCRKMRYAGVRGKGKSGGVRVIYYFLNHQHEVYLIDIYTKSRQADISSARRGELFEIVKAIKNAE